MTSISLSDLLADATKRYQTDSNFTLVTRRKDGSLSLEKRNTRKINGIPTALKRGKDVVYVPYYGIVGARADINELARELNLDVSDRFIIDVSHYENHTVKTHLGDVLAHEYVLQHTPAKTPRVKKTTAVSGMSMEAFVAKANECFSARGVSIRKSKKSSSKSGKKSKRGPKPLLERLRNVKEGKINVLTNLHRGADGRLVGIVTRENTTSRRHSKLFRIYQKTYVDVSPKFIDRAMEACKLFTAETGRSVDMDSLRAHAKKLANPSKSKSRSKSASRSKSSTRKSKSKSRSKSSSRSKSASRSKSRSSSKGRKSPAEKRSPSPKKKSKRSPSPKKTMKKGKRSPSPKKGKRSPSPKKTMKKGKRSPSPKKRSPSPKKRSPSPKKRSPSPKKRSPSPKKRSPSPKKSPGKRSPSKVKVSPRKSPSRHASPPSPTTTTPLAHGQSPARSTTPRAAAKPATAKPATALKLPRAPSKPKA